MFSVKNTARLLTGFGAVTVGAYTAILLLGSCEANLACTASVYFGLPQTEFSAPEISMATKDTTMTVSAVPGFSLADIHEVIQLVGFYALLIGVFTLLVLEVQELKLLRSKSRRKLAR